MLKENSQPTDVTKSEAEKLQERKKGNGCTMAILLSMGVFALTPFLLYYIWHYGKTGEITDVVGIICFIIGILLYIPFAIKLSKASGIVNVSKSQREHNSDTELLVGMMGADMLHRVAKRERQDAVKRRNDSLFWQESIRDRNPRHDFDNDHLDDD